MEKIIWRSDVQIAGTSFRSILQTVYSLPELVRRLEALSGQCGEESADDDKMTVLFQGTWKGQVFTLYDYKGSSELHIGGRTDLDVEGLVDSLHADLRQVHSLAK